MQGNIICSRAFKNIIFASCNFRKFYVFKRSQKNILSCTKVSITCAVTEKKRITITILCFI